MKVTNYLEQHSSIAEEMAMIKKLVHSSNLEQSAGEIALHISMLAGKIKVHLSMEDKYLYPKLLESNIPEIQMLAERYQKEMGSLADSFVKYKEKYNTTPKILGNEKELLQETEEIFKAIELRVEKEEKELYNLIK